MLSCATAFASSVPADVVPRPMLATLRDTFVAAHPSMQVDATVVEEVDVDAYVVTHNAWSRSDDESHAISIPSRHDLLLHGPAGWASWGGLDLAIDYDGHGIESCLELSLLDESLEEWVSVSDRTSALLSPDFAAAWSAMATGGVNSEVAWLAAPSLVRHVDRALIVRVGDAVSVSTNPAATWSQALLVSGGGSKDLVASGTVMKRDQSTWDCWYDCFGEISTPLGLVDMICLGTGIVGCALAGPAYVGCVSLAFTGCGITATLGEIVAAGSCMLKCV